MAIDFDMMSVDAYRLGAYERFSSEREEHIDLISYANDLDTFESKFDCRKYCWR